MLRSQRKIYDLSVQIYLLTMALRDYFDEDHHKDCILEMIERKSKLIKRISERLAYRLEFGTKFTCKD